MPQPYGTIYSRTLTPAGDLNPAHTFMRTGVCDVGTYTVDVALDDDGEYIISESGSVESGVFTAQERIAEITRTGLPPEDALQNRRRRAADGHFLVQAAIWSITVPRSRKHSHRCGALR